MNVKKLGKEQKRILGLIARERLIISTYNYQGVNQDILLCDFNADNIYESLSSKMFNSLISRDIFTARSSFPALDVEVTRYLMKLPYKIYFL